MELAKHEFCAETRSTVPNLKIRAQRVGRMWKHVHGQMSPHFNIWWRKTIVRFLCAKGHPVFYQRKMHMQRHMVYCDFRETYAEKTFKETFIWNIMLDKQVSVFLQGWCLSPTHPLPVQMCRNLAWSDETFTSTQVYVYFLYTKQPKVSNRVKVHFTLIWRV